MTEYIIVYESYTSFYNDYRGSIVEHKGLCNHSVLASSKKEAYEKFKAYTEEQIKEAKKDTEHKHLYKAFTILNIIELQG